MKNSLKLAAAAALFSSVAFGSAMAQSVDDSPGAGTETGRYYQGAERSMNEGGATLNAPLVIQPEKIPGGESAYYPGLERNPGVDRMNTGSINGGTQTEVISGGDGDYYQGATVDSDLR